MEADEARAPAMAIEAQEGGVELGGEDVPAEAALGAKLSGLVQGLLQQMQSAMEMFTATINDINSFSNEVSEDLHNIKVFNLERKSKLEEEREKFQQAACGVLDLLSQAG